MNAFGLRRFAFGVSAAAALLAGCGTSQPPVNTLDATLRARAASEQSPQYSSGYAILHSFRGGSDGELPWAGLTPVNGKLYGTTYSGGGGGCDGIGCGTIFKITVSGQTTVVHRFSDSTASNTAGPEASLLLFNSELYGTTRGIGYGGQTGAVFRYGLGGEFDVLHTFEGGDDGGTPVTPVTALRGKLYGTTSGYDNPGTVFEVETSGHEHTIYDFKGGTDGNNPTGLLPYKGELYGGTYAGGPNELGTIFKITTAGVKKIVYKFKTPPDGSEPAAGLVFFKGKMYGTTVSGGPKGYGTVFEFDPVSNQERVIHSFEGPPSDGVYPEASVIVVNGDLYGTTELGGAVSGGTVFEVTLAGQERIVHDFSSSGDGEHPFGALAELNGKLYGTTYIGGGPCDCGIVFRVSP